MYHTEDCDLSVNNPNKVEETDDRTPQQILSHIEKLNNNNAKLLAEIRELL